MIARGALADVELLSDRVVVESLSDELQHFVLACRELIERRASESGGPEGAADSCGPSPRRPILFPSTWGEAPHKVGIMTRSAGLSPVLTESGKLVKDFIMSMILAIFIDSRIFSCLL